MIQTVSENRVCSVARDGCGRGGFEEKLGRGISASTWNRESRETADTDLPPITTHYIEGGNTGTVLLGRKTTTLLLEIVMVGLLLLLVLHAVVGRQVPSSEHFSQVVQVAVEEKEEDGEVRLVVGNLKLHLGRRAGEHLLDRVLVQEVPGQPGLPIISSLSVCQVLPEAKHLLGESLYAGQLEGEPECAAHAFIEDNQVNKMRLPQVL